MFARKLSLKFLHNIRFITTNQKIAIKNIRFITTNEKIAFQNIVIQKEDFKQITNIKTILEIGNIDYNRNIWNWILHPYWNFIIFGNFLRKSHSIHWIYIYFKYCITIFGLKKNNQVCKILLKKILLQKMKK